MVTLGCLVCLFGSNYNWSNDNGSNDKGLSGLIESSALCSASLDEFSVLLDVKNDVFAHITEPSNDDYDNDVSDNCDHSFGTFDDFGVENDQQVYT